MPTLLTEAGERLETHQNPSPHCATRDRNLK